MSEVEKTIRDTLQYHTDGSLADRVEVLIGTLGYRSNRTIHFVERRSRAKGQLSQSP